MISATPFFEVGELFVGGLKRLSHRNGKKRRSKARPLHGSFRMSEEDAAAGDCVTPFEDGFDGFGINAMLLFQNARAERVFGVSVFDRDDGLQNNRAGIEIFVHEMHRAAGEFYSVFEGLAL